MVKNSIDGFNNYLVFNRIRSYEKVSLLY